MQGRAAQAFSSLLKLNRPLVMGVLNVTPDSFSDGGQFLSPQQAYQHAAEMVEQGVDIIDLGAESTRPGSAEVSVDEELDRLLPVLEQLKRLAIPVSIDTRKPKVMQAAIAAGVAMINDIYALQAPGALDAVKETSAYICLMHMQGLPQTMQNQPHYEDVVQEIQAFFRQRIAACLSAGLKCSQLILDPGIGFGKTLIHNITLIKNLQQFKSLQCPLLVGISRKSMLGALTDKPISKRIYAGIAADTIAVLRGANIIRTHEVQATVDALKVASALA